MTGPNETFIKTRPWKMIGQKQKKTHTQCSDFYCCLIYKYTANAHIWDSGKSNDRASSTEVWEEMKRKEQRWKEGRNETGKQREKKTEQMDGQDG